MPRADFSDRLEAAKKEATLILKDTSNWPKDSMVLAKELFDIISNVPILQEERFMSPSITPEAHASIQGFTSVMEDVCARLNKAYRKYGSNRELSDVIRHPFASLSKDGCETALLKCKYDVDKALASLQDHLKGELAIEHPLGAQVDEDISALNRTPNHSTYSTGTTSAPHGPHTGPTLASSPYGTVSTQQPISSAQNASPTDQDQPGQAAKRRRERLDAARTTFETIEALSGAIPVVGGYVGAGAKVGLAVVKMVQAMDSNGELVKDLDTRTAKLSDLLRRFKDRSVERRREEFLMQLTELQSELQAVRTKVGELNSQGSLRNLFGSGGQAEALKEYQDTIRVALEELQLLASLNTTTLLNEIYDGEVRKEQRRLLDRLGDADYGARGNAIDEVVCLPGTRLEVLERIDDWIRDPSPLERVLWIRGMAGRGKSTIASTVVHNWRYRAAFAIFHFRRGQNALDKRLVCSLARQLGSSMVPEVKEAILQSVRENEDIAQERLQDQFKVLFVASAERLQHTNQPILIVVDALDECEETKYAVDFVSLIHRHASSLSVSFKFLITTRPEAPLLRALEPRGWRTEDLDVIASVDDDIEEFLQRRLSITRENHSLGVEWPPHTAILLLVKMSQGLFQWAQTAVEYVSEGSPELRLVELLESPSLCDALDSLYAQILSKAYEKAKKRPGRGELLLHLLGTLAAAPYPVSPQVFTYLSSDQLLFVKRTEQESIQLLRAEIARDIGSLVYIPASPNQPMRLVHTSVRDLLVDEERCGEEPYFIHIGHKHRNLTMRCFHLMERDLRENICRLTDLSKSNIEIQDVVNREVSNGLRYCCRSWTLHLIGGDWPPETADPLFGTVLSNLSHLSETKLLCWLEVMSLIEATMEALEMAKHARAWLQEIHSVMSDFSLTAIWNDAHRFITFFFEPISFGALHIYASALPLCPTSTKIWEHYSSQATSRIFHGPQDITWPPSLWTRTVRTFVRSVLFLQNWKVVASGGDDSAIRLWDCETGTPLGQPLKGHSSWVSVLALSPDGQTLASGSYDNTIRLWNAETGDLLCQPLYGHSAAIRSLAFSRDKNILLSASDDHTIRTWDYETGRSLRKPVPYSAADPSRILLSPDARILASTLDDGKAIQLWHAQTGTQFGEPLRGHSEKIECLAFSSSDSILATGSRDTTIRLWSSKTGAPIHHPLITKSSCPSVLEFLPDRDILASGSTNPTIQLWNVKTGTQCGEYQAPHMFSITNLAFSPNGKILVSGSCDEIQLLDTQIAPPPSEFPVSRTIPKWTKTIAFSPDGEVLASGDFDGAIRLWDSKTGTLLNKSLTVHISEIACLAFSSDGTVLASGSLDATLCLWDAKTLAPLGSPLEGHNGAVYSITFSADGTTLFSGSEDATIRFWDVRSRESLGEPWTCHDGYLMGLACSSDGKFVASGHCDSVASSHGRSVVNLWDTKTYTSKSLLEWEGGSYVVSLEFLPDQKLLIALTNQAVLYDLVTFQRCYTHTNVDYRAYESFSDPFRSLYFDGQWVTFLSQRLFWFPSPYCQTAESPRISICKGRLAIVDSKDELFIFDVSRSLSP